jgi:hypothetical protein
VIFLSQTESTPKHFFRKKNIYIYMCMCVCVCVSNTGNLKFRCNVIYIKSSKLFNSKYIIYKTVNTAYLLLKESNEFPWITQTQYRKQSVLFSPCKFFSLPGSSLPIFNIKSSKRSLPVTLDVYIEANQ